jgi:hypothetical protein
MYNNMNIEKLKTLCVPVSERLPEKCDIYFTISNIGERMVEGFDSKRKFPKYVEYWLDPELLTTKKAAQQLAKDTVEIEKQYIRDMLICEGYEILAEKI